MWLLVMSVATAGPVRVIDPARAFMGCLVEVGGVTTLPDGRVIVAGVNVPRDSAAVFYRLDTEGVPVARFTLDRRARILLAEGDSLLLHRPTEGEPWELRWVRLREP